MNPLAIYKSQKKKCYFNPTGKTQDECVLRCLAGKDAWGGDLM